MTHLQAARGAREKLPKRRRTTRTKLKVQETTGQFALRTLYVDVGHQPDGRPAELFAVVAGVGSELRGLYDAWAMMVSLALQHGMPVSKAISSISTLKSTPMEIVDGPTALMGKAVGSLFEAVALVLHDS